MGYKEVTIKLLVTSGEKIEKIHTTVNSIQRRKEAFVNEPSTDVPATKPSTERTPTVDVRRPHTKG